MTTNETISKAASTNSVEVSMELVDQLQRQIEKLKAEVAGKNEALTGIHAALNNFLCHSAVEAKIFSLASAALTTTGEDVLRERDELKKRIALLEGGCPDVCPITGEPFFCFLEHPKLGMVPTYGGPYDSYTIPQGDNRNGKIRHEIELYRYRFCHDAGEWKEAESIPIRLIHDEKLIELESQLSAEREAREVLSGHCSNLLSEIQNAGLNETAHQRSASLYLSTLNERK